MGRNIGVNSGESNASAKLTRDEVLEIREYGRERERLREMLKKISNEALAERYGVAPSRISEIITGQSWRGLKGSM